MEAASDYDYEIDWNRCPDVESVLGRCSGAWVVKGTRILVGGILENYDGGLSPEELGEEIFDGLGADHARRIIAYARRRRSACAGPWLLTRWSRRGN